MTKARFIIDGDHVGFAPGLAGDEEIEYEQVEIIDDIEVVEHTALWVEDLRKAGQRSSEDLKPTSVEDAQRMIEEAKALIRQNEERIVEIKRALAALAEAE